MARDKGQRNASGKRGAIFFSLSLASGMFVFVMMQATAHSIIFSPIFQVRELEVQWPQQLKRPADRYRMVPSISIFQVDLQRVSDLLHAKYPVAEVDAVRRVLPNRLVATLRTRETLAQVRSDRFYYPVSEEGVIIGAGQAAPYPNLPILYIDGLHGALKIGGNFEDPVFWRAAELLGALRQGGIAGHRVGSLRSSRTELTLYLDSGVEIRFAADRVSLGWQQLTDLCLQKRKILDEAIYIDLRFQDPVISYAKTNDKTKQHSR